MFASDQPRSARSARRKILVFLCALCALRGEFFVSDAHAHAPVATRTLRLQLRDGKLEGLLVYRLPAQAARVFAAAEDAAVALAPKALAGLRLEADGAQLQPQVVESRARALPGGALEAMLLLDAGAAAHTLRVAVEQYPPLPVELVAGSSVKLVLKEGAGAPTRGGLALRPRPGAACVVTIVPSKP
jgi:hypothetical protein